MSKIVIDAREWNTSTGRYVRNLINGLERIDAQNDYTILLKPTDMERWQPVNPRFTKLACPYKEFSVAEQLGFKKQLDGLKADLVHFPMVQQPAHYNGRVVTTMNDLTTARYNNPTKNWIVFKFKQLVYRRLNKRVARKSRALLTYTEFVKQDVSNFAGISTDKISVTPLAADPITETSEAVSELEKKKFVMYVGRALPHKNLERLVNAFATLRTSHPELLLVLAGRPDPAYKLLEEHVRAQSIEGVVFTGFISDGQLRWLYENCEAYVFPSLSEGFGLPGLEAMLYGAPVASSNATCLPEVYGDAAHYFDPTDETAIADAINEILTDARLRQALTSRGLAQVKRYSWEQTAQKTLAIYTEALLASSK